MLKESVHITVPVAQIEIKPQEIAALMGYQNDIPEPIMDIIHQQLASVKQFEEAEAGYVLYNASYNRETHRLTVGKTGFNVGRTVGLLYKNINRVAVCLGTAGPALSNLSKELMDKGDVLEGYVVDVIGSMVVEKTMDLLHLKTLKTECEQNGLQLTNRYSPGYCEWDIAEQHQLFSLLPENFCNIRLTPSALMMPIKSVSGMVGIGENVRFHSYTCNVCTHNECIYRHKKQAQAE